VDEGDGIVAGHGRVLAAAELYAKGEVIRTVGGSEVPTGFVPVLVARGWSDEEKRAYVIADNQLALNAGWDQALLTLELRELKALNFDIGLIGFSPVELSEWGVIDPFDPEGDDAQEGEGRLNDGALLALVDICVSEPRHQVQAGEVWELGRHKLVVAPVLTGWRQWASFLEGEATVFCPYPSQFVALSSKAADHRLIMVQPDLYIAGHCLDRYVDVHGTGSVRRTQAAPS
jgi:hypothetical protein